MNNESFLVIGTAFVNFVFIVIWWQLFEKQWLDCMPEVSRKKRVDAKHFMIAFIGSIWSTYGMFLFLKHMHLSFLSEALFSAVAIWLLIYVGLGVKHYSFGRVKSKAFVLAHVQDLLSLLLITYLLYS